jgi:hypothetical protein
MLARLRHPLMIGIAIPAAFVIITVLLGLLAFFESLLYLLIALLVAWSIRPKGS